MGMLSRKLHSRRGVSILLAMIFMLVCAFVGTVLLGSATTSAQKFQGRSEDQQQYFAVSSAVQLLRDALETSSCIGTEGENEYGCSEDHSDSGSYRCERGDFHVGQEENLLNEAAWSIFCSRTIYYGREFLPDGRYQRIFTIEAGDLPQVQCELTMEATYNATLVLRPMVDGMAVDSNAMTLWFKASVASDDFSDELDCSHSVETAAGTQTTIYKGTHSSRQVSISWPKATIYKGALADET